MELDLATANHVTPFDARTGPLIDTPFGSVIEVRDLIFDLWNGECPKDEVKSLCTAAAWAGTSE
jgi:hypothetical protein